MNVLLIRAILIMVLWFHCFEGDSQVYKFKAFQTCLLKSGDNREINDYDWNTVDFLIVINLDNKKINVYNKYKDDYDLITSGVKREYTDGDKLLSYDAIDNE